MREFLNLETAMKPAPKKPISLEEGSEHPKYQEAARCKASSRPITLRPQPRARDKGKLNMKTVIESTTFRIKKKKEL